MIELALLHVPRTGGESVRRVASRHYGADQIAVKANYRRAVALDGHRVVGGHLTWSEAARAEEVSVCLRHPVERVISSWRWQRVRRRGAREAEGGLASFARSGLAMVDNGQVRYLAEMSDVGKDRARRAVERADLELALERLDSCTVVGVTEFLAGYVVDLAERYGWECDLSLPTTHQSRRAKPGGQAVREEILERNRLDLELYQAALRRARR